MPKRKDLIVEKLTGKPYDQALEQRINSKIGLRDTYLATGRTDVNKGEALTGSDWTVWKEGGTLFVQPESESVAALEATAPDKFQLFGGKVTFEFDAAKNQMILKRGGRSVVFTKKDDRGSLHGLLTLEQGLRRENE